MELHVRSTATHIHAHVQLVTLVLTVKHLMLVTTTHAKMEQLVNQMVIHISACVHNFTQDLLVQFVSTLNCLISLNRITILFFKIIIHVHQIHALTVHHVQLLILDHTLAHVQLDTLEPTAQHLTLVLTALA